MTWQPIETAPEDDREILVYGGTWVGQPFPRHILPSKAAHVFAKGLSVVNTSYYECWITNPTHWMPLPDPPKEAT